MANHLAMVENNMIPVERKVFNVCPDAVFTDYICRVLNTMNPPMVMVRIPMMILR